MLKSILLNRKKVPIPVPIKTLDEVIRWIESHLMSEDMAITKIELDGAMIESLHGQVIELNPESKLKVQVDSPIELSVQTLDVLRNLTNLMLKDLKQNAVYLWQCSQSQVPEFIEPFSEDIAMILNLIDHSSLLLQGICETSNSENCAEELSKLKIAIEMAISHSDWKGLARLMLTSLEPKLSDLNVEVGHLQKLIFEIQAEQRFKASSSISKHHGKTLNIG